MTRYSVDKASQSLSADCFDFDGILHTITLNLGDGLKEAKRRGGGGSIFAERRDLFSLDGSIQVDLDTFETSAPNFFRQSRRAVRYRGKVHLRGTRYTIASNPTFELRQKIVNLCEDFEQALANLDGEPSLIFQVAMADYIKNSAVTLLNSYMYGEKIGHYHFGDPIYQAIRRDGQKLAEATVLLFYSLMGRNKLIGEAFNEVLQHSGALRRMADSIVESYKSGVFSSRHMTRPEASHPGLIALSALRTTRIAKRPDLLVGLPSGSTELAMAHKAAWYFFGSKKVPLLLFPISLHSVKHDFEADPASLGALQRFANKHKSVIKNKNLVLLDDNSSTGRTLERVNAVLSKIGPKSIDVNVAEADLVRSQIDLKSEERPRIATKQTYVNSVSVLPVSKHLKPKSDMKEMIERSKMVSCIRHRYLEDKNDLTRSLIGHVYIDLVQNQAAEVSRIHKDGPTTNVFRKTFLSNFFKTDVVYHQERFISVEHAYQAMKFHPTGIRSVKDDHLERINRALASRGEKIERQDLPTLFTNPDLTAGTSKIVANQLRRLGYVRSDWDYVKVPIMLDLLIQKFSRPDNYERLQDSNPNYLIEGNDWGDTFWGVCDGRGRNVLGRLTMQIRNTPLKELKSFSAVIREKHS